MAQTSFITESKAAQSLSPLTEGESAASVNQQSKWVKGLRADQGTSASRLFCFPFAGGGASAFATWPASFPRHITVCPIQYPGREDRWGEPGCASLESLVEALASELAPLWRGQFAFFGHSFGALVAFELARALSRLGHTAPVRLFLSGARAPHLPPRESIHELPDGAFLEKLRKYDGMPDEIAGNADLLAAVLPTVRNDFRLFEQYRFQDDGPISIPISVFGGLSDSNIPLADLLAWSARTSKSFRSRFLEGRHFFLFQSQAKLINYIVEDFQASAGPGTSANSVVERVEGSRHE